MVEAITGVGVRAWRERAGLTTRQLGRTLGVDRTTVERWELGAIVPPRFLGYALNYLGAHPERWERGNAGPVVS